MPAGSEVSGGVGGFNAIHEGAAMMVTKIAMDRRTMLRGAGASLALPLLDAMVPAASAAARHAAAPVPRLGFFYVPNGMQMINFVPRGEGTAFEMPKILLALSPIRQHMVIVTGLANSEADPRELGAGPHARANAAWLNGVRPKHTEGADVQAGKTVDQYAADVLGRDTPLR